MAIARVHKSKDFTVMSNYHFREKNMSLKAKGILSLMLSLPDDWDYSIAGLVTLSKDGKDSVMGALTELERFGYLKRSKIINEKGQFAGYDYDIFEQPFIVEAEEEPDQEEPNAENPEAEKPDAENPNTDKPNAENQSQYNTKQSSTKQPSTKQPSTKQLKKKESKKKKTTFDEIIAAYTTDENTIYLLQEWLKVRKAKRAAMTDTAIQMNIDKLDQLAAESNMSVPNFLAEIIRKGWAAFYPIKQWDNKPANNVGATGVPVNVPAEEDEELKKAFA